VRSPFVGGGAVAGKKTPRFGGADRAKEEALFGKHGEEIRDQSFPPSLGPLFLVIIKIMIDEETELYICTIEMCIYGILFKAKQYIDGSDHRAKETKLEHHYKNIESYERTL